MRYHHLSMTKTHRIYLGVMELTININFNKEDSLNRHNLRVMLVIEDAGASNSMTPSVAILPGW